LTVAIIIEDDLYVKNYSNSKRENKNKLGKKLRNYMNNIKDPLSSCSCFPILIVITIIVYYKSLVINQNTVITIVPWDYG